MASRSTLLAFVLIPYVTLRFSLSVSAPNLAVGRQRQRVSVGSGTSGPVENNLLFLEEEEPSETDEANESLSDIKGT